MTAAEIHTPCDAGDVPLPGVCGYPGHINRVMDKRYQRRCRVQRLRPGGQLWFGAQRPDGGRNWLQVGRAEPELPSAVSKVVGRIWFTSLTEGSRVLVENLSTNNTLELRSPRLPRPVTLHPAVRSDPGDQRSELLGTPMVAVQTASTTLTISNLSTGFVVWIEAPIRPLPAAGTDFTFDPRTPLGPREQQELDDAALRIQLADRENFPLLRTFLESDPVRARLSASPSLRAFVERKGIEDWQFYVRRELTNVAEGRPTHEIHRVILEGIGAPPAHDPKWYTSLVAEHLEPDRPINARPGGTGGLTELIAVVKGLWAFRRYQLEKYLEERD
ncbi:hypothetical protein [Paractinoplanes lichenicola]|uniref:FHA domain-containing protein n=1 Tax=Paractinoplanes lichenicola TaxID=2802976 RepID=A0ABS1VGT5_9ACTN|nr:hypothetical protein [Actinoplanes lichenicola]MBL7253916.1 hypothetical protein [Actinoplanes lichenicola]